MNPVLSTDGLRKPTLRGDGMPSLMKDRIEERLRALDLFAREASRRAGLNLGFVGDVLDGRSKKPAAESVRRLAEVLECDLEYLTGQRAHPRRADVREFPSQARSFVAPGQQAAMEEHIPLYAPDFLSSDLWFARGEEAARVAALPSQSRVTAAYALAVPTVYMQPRYQLGEVIYVNPSKPTRIGDFVVIRRRDERITIACLDVMDADGVTLKFLNPDGGPETERVARGDIAALHKIVGSTAAE